MKLVARSIALAVAVSLLVSGPLATFARAQQPPPQPTEQPAQPPAAQPAQEPAPPPAQPPMAQQPQQQPTQQAAQEPPPSPEMVKVEEPREPHGPYVVGAAIATPVYAGGKVLTCAMGIIVGGSLLILTIGSGYKVATAFAKEGCGGKWYVSPEELKGTDWILGTGDRPERN